jgi:hypothetical protein
VANVFVVLPVPAGDGVGPWVDVSGQSPERTISVDGGAFAGTLYLEASDDGQASAAPAGVGPFIGGSQTPQTWVQALQWLRVRRSGSGGVGAPTVAVAAPAASSAVFGAMAVPVNDGVGAAISLSGGGDVNTFQVVGAFAGQVLIETSGDGINFVPALIFDVGGEVGQTVVGVLNSARVRRRGSGGGAVPLVSVGSSATAGAASITTGLEGADVSAMPVGGGIAWAYAPGRLLPTANQDPRACLAVCVMTALGALVTIGACEVPFTVQGGRPTTGTPAWIAAFGDDAGTGTGKATAVRPDVGLGPLTVPAQFPQNAASIGTVLNSNNYVDGVGGTCLVELRLPGTGSALPSPGRESWQGAKVNNLSLANYLQHAGASDPQFNAGAGRTFIIWFTVDNNTPFTGLDILWQNMNAAQTAGWYCGFLGGQFQIAIQPSGDGIGFTNPPSLGLHYFAWSMSATGNVFAATLDGAQASTNQWTAFPVPDASYNNRVGGGHPGLAGWAQGGVLGWATLGRAFTVGELINLKNYLLPSVPDANLNPFLVPDVIKTDPDLYFEVALNDWSTATNNLTTTAGRLGTAQVYSPVGAPTVPVTESLIWYKNTAPLLVDSKPIFYDGKNYPRTSMGARFAVTCATLEDVANIVVAYTNDDYDASDNSKVTWFVNGILMPSFPGLFPSFVGVQGTTGNKQYVRLSSYISAIATAGSYLVEIYAGNERCFRAATYESGPSVVEIIVAKSATFATDATARRLVMVGADDLFGNDTGLLPATPLSNCTLTLQRANYPGRVNMLCDLSGGVIGYWAYGNSKSMRPAAYRIAENAKAGGQPARIDVGIMLGFFGDYYFNGEDPPTYAARLGSLLDELHAILPDAGAGGVAHYYAFEAIQAFYDGTANVLGATLAQYNAALDGLGAGRPWLTIAGVRGPHAIAFNPGGVGSTIPNAIPTQTGGGASGAQALRDNIQAVIGY